MMPATAYNTILAHFNSPDVNHNLQDFAKLTNIQMSDTETVIGYIDRINVLIKWMTTAKYKFKPAWSIHFILHSLPPSYTGIATIIQAQAKATLVYTWTALLQHKSSTLNNISSNSTGSNSLLFTTTQTMLKQSGLSMPSTSTNAKPYKKKGSCS